MRKIFSFLAAMLVSLSMMATQESVDFSLQGYENAQEVTSYTGAIFNVAISAGTNSITPKYYTTGTAMRFYGSNTFTVSSAATMTQIVLTFGSSDGSLGISTDVGSFDGSTWTGSANSVTFTVESGKGNRRIKAISVTVDGEVAISDGYYIVGSALGWDPSAEHKMLQNPANESEYMCTLNLDENDSIKVVQVDGESIYWFPDNAPNYVVDALHAGQKTVYFRPAADGDLSTWFYGCIYIERNPINLGERSIAEFLELANTKDTCVLTGIVANIVRDANDNTLYNVYGNFDLVDGDASVYVYGLLTPDGQEQQFRTMDIDEGDQVTLKGVYKLYHNNTLNTDVNEVVGAVLISRTKAADLPTEPQTIILDMNMQNATVEYYDQCSEQGWWEMYAENNSYMILLSNLENVTVAPGVYTASQLYPEYSYIKTASDSISFVDGSITLTVNDNIALIVGTLVGSDGNNYNLQITYDSQQPVEEETNYYLVGSFNDWAADANYQLTANPSSDGEYMLNISLTAGMELKVLGVAGENETWYPDGMNNNYVVTQSGSYTIYFRPDGQGGTSWYYGYIYADLLQATIATCAEARVAALSVSTDNELYDNGAQFIIAGYVTSIANNWYNSSMTFWMADDENGGNVIEAYKCSIANEEDAVKVGDYVAVTGSLTKYKNTIPEFAAGCTVQMIQRAPEPMNLGAMSIADFIALANLRDTCEITGIVANIVRDTTNLYSVYGNFDLVDGDAQVYIYGLLTADGQAQQFRTMDIDEGDQVTLKGVYKLYHNNATDVDIVEIQNAVFISRTKAADLPQPSVISIDWDDSNADIQFANNSAALGWWQMLAYANDGSYIMSLVNAGTVTSAEGTYTADQLDADYSLIRNSDTEDATFVNGSISVVIYPDSVVITGELIGSDDNIYSIHIAHIIDSAAETLIYLYGTMTDNQYDEAYTFQQNLESEGDEWMFTTQLTEGDLFYIVTKAGENILAVYPNDYAYTITDEYAGLKTIYYRPDYFEPWAEFGGHFYIEANEPVVDPEWDEITFSAADTTRTDFDNVVFVCPTNEQFTLTTFYTVVPAKMAIDANKANFGSPEDYILYAHRLKTGGKSNNANSMALNIPQAGTLRIAVRSANKTATDRTLVLAQGEDTLFNQVIKDEDATTVRKWSESQQDTVDVNYYPYVTIPVKQGELTITYPVGALNFYAFAFKAAEIPEEPEEPVDSTTVFFVNVPDWAYVDAYVWNSVNVDNYGGWPGNPMTLTDMVFNEKQIYSFTFPSYYDKIIFNNTKTNEAEKEQTSDLTWNAATPYYYDGIWYATLEEINPEAQAMFYISGNKLLVGEGSDWDPKAVKSMEDTYTFHLLPGYYELKISLEGDTNTWKGFSDLTALTEGLVANETNNAIAFALAEAGDVVVTYSAVGEDVNFTVTGNFFTIETGFYLVDVNNWSLFSLTEDDKFVPNADVEGEWVINTTLHTSDTIQVVYVQNNVYVTRWGYIYMVDDAHAGEKTVYFRPAGNEAWYEFGGYIYIEANTTTGFDQTDAVQKAVKLLHNGQLIIIQNGVRYNAQGLVVK